MTAKQIDVAEGLFESTVERPADGQVVRRATQLCLRAEPHTDRSPCPAHLIEARRQLVGLDA